MNNLTSDPNDTTIKTEIKSMPNQWKDIGSVGGIYKIVNKIDGKYYVGSTKNFKTRWNQHKNRLNKLIHCNQKLQNAWIKYGFENFEFVILKILSLDELFDVEQIYLAECKLNSQSNYNISYDAYCPTRGRVVGTTPDNVKQKISMSLKGKEFTEERIQNIKNSLRRINFAEKVSGSGNPFYGKKHPKWLMDQIASKVSKGKVYFQHDIHGIVHLTRREMIEKYKLNDSHICRVANGKERQHRGWSLYNSKDKAP